MPLPFDSAQCSWMRVKKRQSPKVARPPCDQCVCVLWWSEQGLAAAFLRESLLHSSFPLRSAVEAADCCRFTYQVLLKRGEAKPSTVHQRSTAKQGTKRQGNGAHGPQVQSGLSVPPSQTLISRQNGSLGPMHCPQSHINQVLLMSNDITGVI